MALIFNITTVVITIIVVFKINTTSIPYIGDQIFLVDKLSKLTNQQTNRGIPWGPLGPKKQLNWIKSPSQTESTNFMILLDNQPKRFHGRHHNHYERVPKRFASHDCWDHWTTLATKSLFCIDGFKIILLLDFKLSVSSTVNLIKFFFTYLQSHCLS